MTGWFRVAAWTSFGALAIAGCGGGGEGDGDAGPPPVGIETLAPEVVGAGQELHVTCLYVDVSGQTYAPSPDVTRSLRIVPEESVERQADGTIIAVRAGRLEVACTFDSLRMTDETPSIVEVTPGEPAHIITTLSRDSIAAGETSEASCEVFDAYGNRIPDTTPTIRAAPERANNTFDGMVGTFEGAGHFGVYCDLPGAESPGAELEVLPGLPASLLLSRVPEQPIYAVGQAVDIARLVTDRFGNEIQDAVVSVTSNMAAQMLGDGRFRFTADGLYRLTAVVRPPTEGGIPLIATIDVLVDSNGPRINCDDPFDGAILNQSPGTSITFRGSVSDPSGVTSVSVNGSPAVLGRGGTFTRTLTTRYGINFIDIAAVDMTGLESSKTCAFLVSSIWAPDSQNLSDVISLRLRQPVLDRSPGTNVDTLGDLVHTMINSSGLRSTIHSELLSRNPLHTDDCFFGCIERVDYLDSDFNPSPLVHVAQMNFVDGGLRVVLVLRDVGIKLRINPIPGGAFEGWVRMDSVQVEVTFNTSVSGGRPRLTTRPGSVSASISGLTTDFSGVLGWIVDLIVSIARGAVTDAVEDVLEDWAADNLDDLLDSAIGSLDIDSLGTSFNVPRLDGSGTIPLTFGVGFSSLTTNTSRMLFGVSTRFYAPPAHARTTFGAPVRYNNRILDASGTTSTAVAVHEALLNQAVHALWRGGFLDATISGGSLGLPSDSSATISTGLPPVIQLRSDARAELALGAISMSLVYPDFFGEPVYVNLGARASMNAWLLGEDLHFDDFRIEELYFSTDIAGLDMATRNQVEDFLRRMLSRVIGSALNDALPAIPIPSFELPSSLTAYGVPAGTVLGLNGPSLSNETPHFVLRGAFGAR